MPPPEGIFAICRPTGQFVLQSRRRAFSRRSALLTGQTWAQTRPPTLRRRWRLRLKRRVKIGEAVTPSAAAPMCAKVLTAASWSCQGMKHQAGRRGVDCNGYVLTRSVRVGSTRRTSQSGLAVATYRPLHAEGPRSHALHARPHFPRGKVLR